MIGCSSSTRPRTLSLVMVRTVRLLPMMSIQLKKSGDTITGLFNSINAHMATMSITIPEDKKKVLTKEIKAIEEKLEVLARFKSTVTTIEQLVANLTAFDDSLKAIDTWKDAATAELKDIKEFNPWLAGAEKDATQGLSKPA